MYATGGYMVPYTPAPGRGGPPTKNAVPQNPGFALLTLGWILPPSCLKDSHGAIWPDKVLKRLPK